MHLNEFPLSKDFNPGDCLLMLETETGSAKAYRVQNVPAAGYVLVSTPDEAFLSLNLAEIQAHRITPDDCIRSQKTGHIYRFEAIDSLGSLAFAKVTNSPSEFAHLRVRETLVHSFDYIPDMPRGYKVQHPLPPGTKIITEDGVMRMIVSVKPVTHSIAASPTTTSPTYTDTLDRSFGNFFVSRAWDIPTKWTYISPAWQAARRLKAGDVVWAHHFGCTGKHTITAVLSPERTDASGEADSFAYEVTANDKPGTTYNLKVIHVYFRHKTAEEMKEEENKKMSENKTGEQKGLDMWKASAVKGAYRATGRQLVSKTKSLGIMFLRSKLSAEDAESVAKFANNKYADGIVSAGIGAILTYTPMIKDRKHAKLVAEELRSDGFSHMFEGVVEFATQTLLPVILGGLNALDSFESKVDAMTAPELRVAAGVASTGISDAAIKEAEAEAAAALEAEMLMKKPTLSVVQDQK